MFPPTSSRDLAAAAAEDAFKDGLKQVFEVLWMNIEAPDAMENATRGIAQLQDALTSIKGLIQTLPA